MKVYQEVSKLCHKYLLDDDIALSYLRNRGLTDESIAKFEFGVFPQDLRKLFSSISPIDLRTSGIIFNASHSKFKTQDIVFPIRDVYGDYIAIAGRTRLSDDSRANERIPKYINSAYTKSHHLFGLNFAKYDILRKNIVYIVEGYFDVVIPHQKSINNVVAVCGKYLSTRQIALLSRYTDKMVLLFDNENEAQQRAKKIVAKKRFDGITLEAANPFENTNAKDIDEYLSGHSVKDFMSALNICENREDYANIKAPW